jgi:hypothetical protein
MQGRVVRQESVKVSESPAEADYGRQQTNGSQQTNAQDASSNGSQQTKPAAAAVGNMREGGVGSFVIEAVVCVVLGNATKADRTRDTRGDTFPSIPALPPSRPL